MNTTIVPRNRITFQQFIADARSVHNDKYEYDELSYRGVDYKTRIYCNACCVWFEQTPGKHKAGQGCRACGYAGNRGAKLDFGTFAAQAREIHGDKYEYDRDSYKGVNYKTRIYCNACCAWFEQTPNGHKAGRGCEVCSYRAGNRKPAIRFQEFLIDARKTHGDKYEYDEASYVKKSEKTRIYCKNCKKWFLQSAKGHVKGRGCEKCKSSAGEKLVVQVLKSRNIIFETQKRFSTCKDKRPLPFDFYLPYRRIAIEYQGRQHYIPYSFCSDRSSEAKNLADTQRRDEIKRQWCKRNSIGLIEVKYDCKDIESYLLAEIHRLTNALAVKSLVRVIKKC